MGLISWDYLAKRCSVLGNREGCRFAVTKANVNTSILPARIPPYFNGFLRSSRLRLFLKGLTLGADPAPSRTRKIRPCDQVALNRMGSPRWSPPIFINFCSKNPSGDEIKPIPSLRTRANSFPACLREKVPSKSTKFFPSQLPCSPAPPPASQPALTPAGDFTGFPSSLLVNH